VVLRERERLRWPYSSWSHRNCQSSVRLSCFRIPWTHILTQTLASPVFAAQNSQKLIVPKTPYIAAGSKSSPYPSLSHLQASAGRSIRIHAYPQSVVCFPMEMPGSGPGSAPRARDLPTRLSQRVLSTRCVEAQILSGQHRASPESHQTRHPSSPRTRWQRAISLMITLILTTTFPEMRGGSEISADSHVYRNHTSKAPFSPRYDCHPAEYQAPTRYAARETPQLGRFSPN